MANMYQEKADQAAQLLHEVGLDCWLTFVRETTVTPDPGVEMVVGADVTWPSAFLFGKGGERIAIVGRYDMAALKPAGVFSEVIGYDEGIRTPLIETLDRLKPQSIGLNYSVDDKTSDGLTHGMWLLLNSMLEGTPYASCLTSAGPLLTKLRARKTPAEVARIQGAIATTEAIVAQIGAQIKVGKSEAQVGAFVHGEFQRLGLPSAWAWDACPIVNSGPESEPGHAGPRDDIFIQPGHLVHIDLGVQQEGYCSDIQRMWYVLRPGETAAPPVIQRAFATVLQAIDTAAQALKPGAIGWEIDQIAREIVIDNGYEEYKHALGHGLGRACHDGGPLLGPRWERYGNTPMMQIEAGNVYTLELGIVTEAGYVGLEEDVLVTETGCVFLSKQQRELPLIQG
jgi:Xaa-Pro aminopeptidase